MAKNPFFSSKKKELSQRVHVVVGTTPEEF